MDGGRIQGDRLHLAKSPRIFLPVLPTFVLRSDNGYSFQIESSPLIETRGKSANDKTHNVV
jgi:hypothetical protein